MVQELFDFSLSLSPDDFPGKIRTVALRIGVKEAAILMDRLQALRFISATGKDLLNHQYIKENYNGFNALSLGIKLRMNSAKVKALADKPCASIESIYSAQLKIVAKECGNDIAKKLLSEFPGERIMVPSDHNFLKRLFVRKHFHGNNTYDLAVKLRVSDRFIRKIVSEMYEDQNNLQLSLFK